MRKQVVLSMSGKNEERINCFKCSFFKITWNPRFPYACRAYGFKGQNLPSQDVLSASGLVCMHFKPKPEKKTPSGKKYPDYI